MTDNDTFDRLMDEFDPEASPKEMTTAELADHYGNAAALSGYLLALREQTADKILDSSSMGTTERLRRAVAVLRGQKLGPKGERDSADRQEAIADTADSIEKQAEQLSEILADRVDTDDLVGYQ